MQRVAADRAAAGDRVGFGGFVVVDGQHGELLVVESDDVGGGDGRGGEPLPVRGREAVVQGGQTVGVEVDAVAGGLVVRVGAAFQDVDVDVGLAQPVGEAQSAEACADDEYAHAVSFTCAGCRRAGRPGCRRVRRR